MAYGRLELAQELLGQPLEPLVKVSELYAFKLSRFLHDRIQSGTYSLTAARQFLPDARELSDHIGAKFDPCNEKSFKATDHVIQKYNNRAALIVTHHCLVYCRFCFRRDFVGFAENKVTSEALEESFRYLEANTDNRDVLVTGGDPLALPNHKLIPILKRLSDIDHIKVIRVHTRALSAQPDRFDDELLTAIRLSGKVWLYAHMNHPDDIDHPEVYSAVERIRMTGTPILNQAVILAGINDDPCVLNTLCLKLYEAKIIPYHVYILDRVPGTSHFFVEPEKLYELFESLTKLPGPAQPVFVVMDREDFKHKMMPGVTINKSAFLDLIQKKYNSVCKNIQQQEHAV